MADEMDFLELVIASERVAKWLDVLHLGTDKAKCACRVSCALRHNCTSRR
jgi:hypothetical protein